jgi:serine/threonine protein kinase/Tol biopolymer transport system component
MGEVWRARDISLHRDVALKVLLGAAAADPIRLVRLRREAQVLASLNHPLIASIYGFEEGGATPALVLELVDGQTLGNRLLRGPLPVAIALRFAAQIAEALQAAHERGVVHCDLKPGNVMLRPDGTVKVLDFGLATALRAKQADESDCTRTLERAGTIAGTPAYMAPEQARGDSVDARADIWAFGCVLYEMLTGRSIFAASSVTETLAKVLESRIDLEALPAETPRSVRRLVRRCLDRSLRDRLQHIGDARADLEDAQTEPLGEPVSDARRAPNPAAPVTHTRSPYRKTHLALMAFVVSAAIVGFAWLRPDSSIDSDRQLSWPPAEPPVQLTKTGNALLPSISPDRLYVVYVERGARGDALRRREIQTGTTRTLVEARDDVWILAVTATPPEVGDFTDYVTREGTHTTLWRMESVVGAISVPLLDDVSSASGWDPDGLRFAFVRMRELDAELWVADANGDDSAMLVRQPRADHSQTFLTLVHPDTPWTAPAWSPDGKTIALAGFRNVTMFVDVKDRTIVSVPQTSAGLGGAWINNSTLFWSGGQLQSMTYPSAQLARLTRDLSNYVGVSLSRDRDFLVTTSTETTDTEIRVLDLAGRDQYTIDISSAQPLTLSIAEQIAWAGERILYGALSSDGPGLWAVQRGRGQTPYELIPGADSPAATADGSVIVYVSRAKGQNSLWKADRDGRNRQRLTNDAHWPTIASGEEVVFVDDTRTNNVTTWSVKLSGNGEREIIHMDARNPDVSTDGRLAFVSSDSKPDGIMICDLSSCRKPQHLTPVGFPPRNSQIRWTPNRRGIAYVNIEDPLGHNIWIQPLDGNKEATRLTRLEDDRRIVSFAYSADGKSLAILRARTRTDVVLFKGVTRAAHIGAAR